MFGCTLALCSIVSMLSYVSDTSLLVLVVIVFLAVCIINRDYYYEHVYSSNKTVRQTERQSTCIYTVWRHSIHIRTTINAQNNRMS